MTQTIYRTSPTSVAVHVGGRGVIGGVHRVDFPRRRFVATINHCSHGRFARQADAVVEVVRLHASIERGSRTLGYS